MNGLRYVIAVLVLAGAAAALAQSPPIDSKDLLNGLANQSRWLTHSGNYASTRHSPLTQITPENVGTLAPLWCHRRAHRRLGGSMRSSDAVTSAEGTWKSTSLSGGIL